MMTASNDVRSSMDTWQGDTPHYDWERFWESWEDERAAVPATDYLPEMDSHWERSSHTSLKTLDQLQGIACLVLLGEPGIGKSTAVKAEADRLRQAGHRVVYHDLKAFAGPDDLIGGIFTNNSLVDTTLFLDSLDEGLTVVERLATVLPRLIREAREDPAVAASMRIRITCRSTEWPLSATQALRSLFPAEEMQVWHLCRLRRSDVELAASHPRWGLDGAAFSEEVGERRAVAFAVKPVTLNLLLQVRTADGILPDRQQDLYRQGLTELCKDPNVWRREENEAGRLPVERRLALARRVAALSILCHKPFVERVVRMGPSPASLLCRRDIRGGEPRETADGATWEFTDAELDEVLGCGLFRGMGHTVAWAHQTYAEFLAADFLIERGLTEPQIEGLILPSANRDGRVAPQLYELASWLASIDDGWRRRLLACNADILLRSDVAAADAAVRCALADRYLAAIDAGEIDEVERTLYPRLAAPDLAATVRPFLAAERRPQTRAAAVAIAESCRCDDLAPTLTGIALDEHAPREIRFAALRAAMRGATDALRDKIVPLVASPDDDLKYEALRHVWPHRMKTPAMLEAIDLPVMEYRGTYIPFIATEIAERIPAADLPDAMRWMTGFILRFAYEEKEYEYDWQFRISDYAELARALVERAIAHIDDHCVRAATATTLRAMLVHSWWLDWPRWQIGALSTDGKYKLVAEMLAQADRDDCAISITVHTPFAIGLADRDLAVSILSRISADRDILRQVRAVLATFDDDLALELDARPLPGIIPPATGEVLVAALGQRREWIAEGSATGIPIYRAPAADEPPQPAIASVDPEISDIVLGVTAGTLNVETAWHRILQIVADIVEADFLWFWTMHAGSSLQKAKPWPTISPRNQSAIIGIAVRYLDAVTPHFPQDWPEWSAVLPFTIGAGALALDTVAAASPTLLGSLATPVLAKWAVAACVRNHDDAVKSALMSVLRTQSRDAYLTLVTLSLRYQLQSGRQQNDAFTAVLRDEWDDDVAAIVADLLEREDVDGRALRDGAALLFRHDHPRAHRLAAAALRGPASRRNALILLTALRHHRDRYWPVLWRAMQRDPELCLPLILHAQNLEHTITRILADEDDPLAPRDRPVEEQGAFALLLMTLATTAHRRSGDMEDAARMAGIHARDIGRHLAETATPEALEQLLRLREAGHDDFIPMIIACKENMRRRGWQPPAPRDLLALATGRDRRLVACGRELLDTVVDSLRRFQDELHGKTPQRHIVWNTVANDYQPKEENEISDIIAFHLQRDLSDRGIVVNREVEVRPPRGGERGHRTDIHIDAVSRSDRTDIITLIIEVKGCWHDELKTAMQTQLVDGYLAKNGVPHGLYVAAWFLCPAWSKGRRHADAMRHGWDYDTARTELAAQATALSTAGRDVRVVVLDARWPGDGLPPPKKAKGTSGKKRGRPSVPRV